MRTVTVNFTKGDQVITDINGTNETIAEYYAIGKTFNLGSNSDKLDTVKSIVIHGEGGVNYE